MGLCGREGKEANEGVLPKPNPNWEGGRPPPLSFLPPSSSFPLPLQIGKGGVLLPEGVGLPPWARLLLLAGPLLPSFIYRGGGHPIDTTIDPLDLLAVCGAPSTIIHLGHIVAVLRRSPASVATSSPSPCRRADGTLPRSSAGSEFVGRHRAERVLNSEVPYVRCLDRSDREDV